MGGKKKKIEDSKEHKNNEMLKKTEFEKNVKQSTGGNDTCENKSVEILKPKMKCKET